MTADKDADFGRLWEYRLINSLSEVYDEGQFGSDIDATDWARDFLTQSPRLSGYPIRLERFKPDTSEWILVWNWDSLHAG